MADKIEPALTAEDWSVCIRARGGSPTPDAGEVAELVREIALANYDLPDSDPRKITREMVAFLRSWQKECAESYNSNMEDDAPTYAALADALESYLPPAPISQASDIPRADSR